MTDIKWDGTGLLPVGVECEYTCNLGDIGSRAWFKCTVLDVGQRGFTLQCPHLENDSDPGLQFFPYGKVDFRPIKTERDRVIENAMENLSQDDLRSLDWSREHAKRVAGQLYDAGLLTKPQ